MKDKKKKKEKKEEEKKEEKKEKEVLVRVVDNKGIVSKDRSIEDKVLGIKRRNDYLRFVEWFSTPQHLRKPKLQKELAKELGTTEDRLSDWKRHDTFRPLVQERMKIWGQARTPNVMAKHYLKIMSDGDPQLIRLWYEFFEGWIRTEGREVVDKTFEDLLARLQNGDRQQENNRGDVVYTEQKRKEGEVSTE